MKQSDMRKLHRNIGIIIAVFIVLQAGSGLLITIAEFSEASETPVSSSAEHEYEEHEQDTSTLRAALGWIHYDSSAVMSTYRILLGIGILVQTIIGGMMFFDIRRRLKAGRT